MLRLSLVLAIALGAFVQSCGRGTPRTGYQRVDGRWAWVADAASFLQHAQPLDVDDGTFEILDDGYARDAHQVFYEGAPVDRADAASFQALGGFYGRDRSRVYLAVHQIPGADPASFETLAMPYARDARDVYYGTVPMRVADPAGFRVVTPGGGIAVTPVRYLADLHGALADTLLARGYAPDSVVVVGTAGLGAARAGERRYEGARPLP